MQPNQVEALPARVIAWVREDDPEEPCERGTVGCAIDHTSEAAQGYRNGDCETW